MSQTATAASRNKRLTYAGIASVALGLLDLFFLTAPFMMVYDSFVSGYDLALGQYYLSGVAYSLGISYPVVWICLAGGVLAILTGIDAMFPNAGNRQPNYWNIVDLIGISGLVVMVCAGILLLQLTTGPQPLTEYIWGVLYGRGSTTPMWGAGAEFAIGLGLITAAWSK